MDRRWDAGERGAVALLQLDEGDGDAGNSGIKETASVVDHADRDYARGSCTFVTKATLAAGAGAVATRGVNNTKSCMKPAITCGTHHFLDVELGPRCHCN